MPASALSRVAAIDGALPAAVNRELRAAIVELEGTRGDSRTNWYELAAPPRHLFEQVIQQLRRRVPAPDEYVGAEWWFRATSTDADFPFHFDRDEGIRSRIVSPTVASILYLSNTGGPTLILDATPSRVAAPRAGLAVHPRAGRFVMFPGALLHGVVPGRPSRWPRITMLVNWWRSVPRMERAPRRRLVGSSRWPGGADRTTARIAPLESIDPARLLAPAAWRALVAEQLTYR